MTHKPDSVTLPKQVKVIYLSDQPGELSCWSGTGRTILSLFDLAPGGVYPAKWLTPLPVVSYTTISPLPAGAGGIFSVALSIDSDLALPFPR